MTPRIAIGITLAALITTTHAGTTDASGFISCVGRDFANLPHTAIVQSTQVQKEFCLSDADLTVCRSALSAGDTSDNTMAVSIRAHGVIVQRWFEMGDPGYLDKMHAFRSMKDKHVLIVATQQSESQGMGAQEWDVNVVSVGEQSGQTRRTFNTTEFGPSGALVKPKAPTDSSCSLLLTRWVTQQTPQGERLFLVGQLIDLHGEVTADHDPTSWSRRFDRRFERQRASQPASRPLDYFKHR
jgi:hypothetical protein